jgi:2-succinyl-5-enolpyruvyl-6-hydroxy-3-cyclohexene-1-carboxylate synthase
VLRIGALLRRSRWQFMQRARRAQQIVVDDGGWPDPIHAASSMYHGDPASFCRALLRCERAARRPAM